MPPSKMKAYADFDAYLAGQSPRNQVIIRVLRRFVKRVEPGLTEAVKWGNGCWVGRQGPVAYVYSDTEFVQFGFFHGAILKDPKGLLEGKGKYVRHIKVHARSGINELAFAALLKQVARFRYRGSRVTPMPTVLASTHVLAVTDLAVSSQFYIERLGFTEDMNVEGWSFLSRGACRLRLGHCPDAMPMSKAQDHSWFAYLHVQDAKGLYDEVVAHGVEIWHPLADTHWGMREFAIVTPDGHRIVFGERLA